MGQESITDFCSSFIACLQILFSVSQMKLSGRAASDKAVK